MITKTEAIKIATAIVDALQQEEKHPDLQGVNNKARFAARGMAAKAIDALYFSLPEKTRAAFDYSYDELFKAAGWR